MLLPASSSAASCDRLDAERAAPRPGAAEAERLRDELGHRVDVLEAANRCARALGSSLELDEAFGAFIRELRGLVPFDRTAIVLVEGETRPRWRPPAAAPGRVPAGNTGPLHGLAAGACARRATSSFRRGPLRARAPGDEQLLALGLRSELVAPLLLGARTIGMLSLSRGRVDAFSDDEVELVALLGRLVATAVQNIRATRPSGDGSRARAVSRSSGPTSSPSSPTSCAARWRR